MKFNLLSPSEQIVEVISLIYKNKMTTISGGNLSIKDENDEIWITPAAIDKGNLKPSDIMNIKRDGQFIGLHKPSSELPFHNSIYEKRPDIKAIIHAHPPALVTWSIIKKVPDTGIVPRINSFCKEIGFAEYSLPGSQELGNNISETFKKGFNAVLLENHGIVIGSNSLINALHKLETLEYFSRSLIQASKIGNINKVKIEEKEIEESRDQKVQDKNKEIKLNKIKEKKSLNKEFEGKQIKDKLNEDKENINKIKNNVMDIIHRACKQQLMFGVEGIVSHRIDDRSFLISLEGLDRRFMTKDDVVQIDNSEDYGDKMQSNQFLLHKEIYNAHPEINALITTSSTNVLAYAISDVMFNSRTIPESYIVLRNINKFPYSNLLSNKSKIVHSISLQNPVILIENDSILVAGKNLLEAFDRIEVAEFCAKSSIDAISIGDINPMGEDEINEIKKHYL